MLRMIKDQWHLIVLFLGMAVLAFELERGTRTIYRLSDRLDEMSSLVEEVTAERDTAETRHLFDLELCHSWLDLEQALSTACFEELAQTCEDL